MKYIKKQWKWLSIVCAIVLSISFALSPLGVTVGSSGKFLSINIERNSVIAYSPTWYQDSELSFGLWYSDINNPVIIDGLEVSFMKIYSGFAGDNTLRVMEISTYPRAYKDTSEHVYTVDTPFVVGQDDLNDYYNSEYAQQGGYQYRPEIADETNVYVDTRQLVFLIGETATHYAGDPLPGAFPLWLESETLSTPTNADNRTDTFYYLKTTLLGQLRTSVLHEAYWRRATTTTWNQVSADLITQMQANLDAGNTDFKIPKIQKNQHRYVLRVLYNTYHN